MSGAAMSGAIFGVSLAFGTLAVLYTLAIAGKLWGARFEAWLEKWWLFPLAVMGTVIALGAVLIGVSSGVFAVLTAVFA